MDTPNFYILTEGKNDSKIVQSLIKGIDNYQLLHANGLSSLLSTAVSILITKNSHVIIFADTDSVEYDKNKDKDVFIKEMVRYKQYQDRLKIILAAPELEVALFNHKQFFENYFDIKISDAQWIQMRHAPKQFLHYLFNTESDKIYDTILKDPKWESELYASDMRKELMEYYEEKTAVAS